MNVIIQTIRKLSHCFLSSREIQYAAMGKKVKKVYGNYKEYFS